MTDKPYLKKISDEDLAEYEETFLLYDNTKDGFITTNNLGKMNRSLGFNPTESELQDMIVRFDTDRNGKIDLDEFCKMMDMMKKLTTSEEELLLAFKVLDKSLNGYISRPDLHEVLQNLGENFTTDYIDEIFHEADQDGDGVISLEEFNVMMK